MTARLEARMRAYFDPAVSHAELRRLAPRLMESTARFNAEATRETLQRRGFLPQNIVRYCYRPLDLRWLYWEPETKLLDEKRADYFPHVFEGNVWLEARQRQPKEEFDRGYFVRVLTDNFGSGLSSFFPLFLAPTTPTLFDAVDGPAEAGTTNLSARAREYLAGVNMDAATLFFHALAVLHAPAYRGENAGALRQGWPRIPLPLSADALRASAALGREVAALLDPEQPVPGVTTGTLPPDLRAIAVVARVGGGALDPATDLALTAGWGHAGRDGVTMPGRGRAVERDAAPGEASATGRTFDIYLNDIALWRNIPADVWGYTLGGYPVLKKWLSYRERPLLGRPLSPDEVRQASDMARRLAALLHRAPALDENYGRVR